MGIENREYMTEGPHYRAGGWSYWSAVKLLIVINVVVFLLQTIFPLTLEIWFALIPDAVLHGQIWRLTTYDFLHQTSDNLPLHLLFNMWLLWLAGGRVESVLGKNEFLAFYLLAGILSGITFMLWGMVTKTSGIAIGASGAAVAVMIVYALNWPQERWYIWGILPIPVIVLAALSALFDIMPMLQELRGPGQGDRIAHSAHVGGMLFGFLYARYRWRILDWLPSSTGRKMQNPFRRRPNLRVHVPEQEQPVVQQERIPATVEARLDELLEKISQHGEASLTDQERRFLTDTSRRYRNRK
ncbi:rhomboid family intramembrane serine protease [Planctomicrobium piriforme]|uniref:Membrane associated serine protease, rhomboid family n=1 Tax=Planctomicrobium piriforme TaxID=1576369 RepID=A0A1I3P9G5_9PLAN|nr:rhomboid family intramembrane serine protease [Planctomicrobium piriforme]SFJ18165.1 Membrane associated serine protease, rhomboid family [Planctomicrobium piriforme]